MVISEDYQMPLFLATGLLKFKILNNTGNLFWILLSYF